MRRLGFTVSPNVTHVCPLPRDEASAWAAPKGTCRTRIRKAEKSGLESEITDDGYPQDERSMYYWDGASDLAHLEICP